MTVKEKIIDKFFKFGYMRTTKQNLSKRISIVNKGDTRELHFDAWGTDITVMILDYSGILLYNDRYRYHFNQHLRKYLNDNFAQLNTSIEIDGYNYEVYKRMPRLIYSTSESLWNTDNAIKDVDIKNYFPYYNFSFNQEVKEEANVL